MNDLFTRHFWTDALERVGATFIESVVAAVAAGALSQGINATTGHTLLIAGLAAAAATAKSIVASAFGGISPASLVTVKETKKKQ